MFGFFSLLNIIIEVFKNYILTIRIDRKVKYVLPYVSLIEI